METRVIYCSACDRNVEVVLPATATGPEPELTGSVCLDLGQSCTGALCPICGTSPGEQRAELVKLGLRPPA